MKHRPIFIASGIVAIAAAIAAAGCGGGTQTSGVAPITAAAANTAQATLSIVIPPASSTSSSSRGTEYVSPSTASVSFQLPSMTSPTVVAVGPGVSGCTGSVSTGYTCTASFSAPYGANQVLTVKTYASSNGTGSVLAQGTTTITVTSTGPNTASVTLNGVAASIALSLSDTPTVTVGTPGSATLTWSAKDASGNTIIAPGTLVDASGTALATPSPSISPSADSSAFSIGSYSGTAVGGSWPVAYNGGAASSPMTITASVTNSGVTAGTLQITVNPAPTASPSASPTATASPSPSPTATATANTNVIVNGTFAVNDFTGAHGWYTCYAPRYGTTTSATPINASPAPVNQNGNASAGPTPVPTPGALFATDTTQQTTTPTGTAPPSGNAQFALIGYSGGPAPLPSPAASKPHAGNTGICQNIASVPTAATLKFNIYEGGDDDWAKADDEADLYPAGSFTGTPAIATVAPTVRLYAQNNCYDSAAWMPVFLAAPYGTGGVTASPTGRYAGCPETPGSTNTPSGLSSLGGYWYAKSLSMSAYAGQSIVLFIGISRDAGSGGVSTGTASYYSYMFVDNVYLGP